MVDEHRKVATPVMEKTLKDEKGVWIREVYPDFFIQENDKPRFHVKGIPYEPILSDKQRGDVFIQAVRHQLERVYGETTRLKKETETALRHFVTEYGLLRENGMDGLFRAAKKDGIHFVFYENPPGYKEDHSEDPIAVYDCTKDEIFFATAQYYPDSRLHNSLAHELGHYIMDNRTQRSKEYLCNVVNSSPMGQCVAALMSIRGFLGDEDKWRDVFSHLQELNGNESAVRNPFRQFCAKASKEIQRLYESSDYNAEMFCRTLGYLAYHKNGLKKFTDASPFRQLAGIVVKMAEAYGNGNTDLYDDIVQTVSTHQPDFAVGDVLLKAQMAMGRIFEVTTSHKNLSVMNKMKLHVELQLLYAVALRRVSATGEKLVSKINELERAHPTQKKEQDSLRNTLDQLNKQGLNIPDKEALRQVNNASEAGTPCSQKSQTGMPLVLHKKEKSL